MVPGICTLDSQFSKSIFAHLLLPCLLVRPDKGRSPGEVGHRQYEQLPVEPEVGGVEEGACSSHRLNKLYTCTLVHLYTYTLDWICTLVQLYTYTLDWMNTLVHLYTSTVPGDQRGGGLVGAGRGGGGQVVIARRVLETARI